MATFCELKLEIKIRSTSNFRVTASSESERSHTEIIISQTME